MIALINQDCLLSWTFKNKSEGFYNGITWRLIAKTPLEDFQYKYYYRFYFYGKDKKGIGSYGRYTNISEIEHVAKLLIDEYFNEYQ